MRIFVAVLAMCLATAAAAEESRDHSWCVNPNTTDGIESLQTSYWTPRQIQFTARLSF